MIPPPGEAYREAIDCDKRNGPQEWVVTPVQGAAARSDLSLQRLDDGMG